MCWGPGLPHLSVVPRISPLLKEMTRQMTVVHSWNFFFLLSLPLCRALHWVTPQMLCVPVNEEISEVSDMVVKAITGQ